MRACSRFLGDFAQEASTGPGKTDFFGAAGFPLCGGSDFAGCLGLEKVVEDGAILDHCGAQLFGGGFHLADADGDRVREAVVLHDARVADGHIGCALLKAGPGIAAGLKKRIDQVIGFGDRGFGMVDEAGLDRMPLCDKAIALGDA